MPSKGVPYHLFCEMLGMTKPAQRNNLVIYVIDPAALQLAKDALRHFDIIWSDSDTKHWPYWTPSMHSIDSVIMFPMKQRNEKIVRKILGKSTKQRAYWPAEAIAKELAKPSNNSLILGNAFGIL